MFRRLVLVFVVIACSSNPSPAPQNPTVRFATENATPNYMDVPFPSDAYLQNGLIGTIPGLDAIVTENATMLQQALSVQNGFGRVAFTAFYIDDPSAPPNDDGSVAAAQIDTTTLPQTETACVADGSAVFLLDLEAAPSAMRLPCRAYYHVAPLGHTRPVLGVGAARGLVLAGSHKYAVVVTDRVKDMSGKPITASADFTEDRNGRSQRSRRSAVWQRVRHREERTRAGARHECHHRHGCLHHTYDGARALRFARRPREQCGPCARMGCAVDGADGRDEVHERFTAPDRIHRQPRRLARRRDGQAARQHR